MNHKNQVSHAFRMDIHALRGIAVLLVVLYHTQLSFKTAGYLGVDIFFVISGFLITGIIRRDLAAGTFSFRGFYWRRAKRILPASFATIALCYAVSDVFLTSEVAENFIQTALASLVFVSNISLWLQSDYFSSSSALQPLLHMWSLAIEEQFYLFLPLLLFILPLRHHMKAIAAVGAASLMLCLLFVATKTSATFYLLPTRAWALLLGAGLAIAVSKSDAHHQLPSGIGLLGLFAVVAVPAFAPGKQLGWPHPSLDSILVCTGVAAIIMSRCPPLASGALSRLLGWFGTISFSLYLVHWPIVAFLNNAYMLETPPVLVRAAAAVASVALALILFFAVEKPMRYASGNKAAWRGLAIAGVLLACVGIGNYAFPKSDADQNFAERLRPNTGFSDACEFIDTYTPNPQCQTSDAPQILIWGDSYAMHLVPAFTATQGAQIAQATKSVCGPVSSIVPLHSDYLRGTQFVDDCISFNRSVIDYLKEQSSVETVVLSSVFNQYFYLDVVDENGVRMEMTPHQLADEIASTAKTIRDLGKKVVLVAPTPSEGAGFNPEPGFDIGLCLERTLSGRIVAGRPSGCAIREEIYHTRENLMLATLAIVEERGDLPIIRLAPMLCENGLCRTNQNDTLIFRDKGHLSIEGARWLGGQYDLLATAQARAR